MPTQIDSRDTSRYLVKFYRLNKSQTVAENEEAIFYVTVLVKGYPPKYEHIHNGLPEVEKAIEGFKKELKQQAIIK